MRFSSFGLISTTLFAAVVGNAWMQRGNAYASLIHMTKSSGNMMVSFQFFLYLSVLLGRVLSSLFFGQLRASEVEHLYEKSWFAVTETALAMTIFRDEFDVKFVALFLGLLGVKIFHWIMAGRVDYVSSPLPSLPAAYARQPSARNWVLVGIYDLVSYAGIPTLR
jgi:hypothetical protein